jgi:hypothetical protein
MFERIESYSATLYFPKQRIWIVKHEYERTQEPFD